MRRTNTTVLNQSIRTAYNAHFAEGAETLSPDLLESAMEELFKTV